MAWRRRLSLPVPGCAMAAPPPPLAPTVDAAASEDVHRQAKVVVQREPLVLRHDACKALVAWARGMRAVGRGAATIARMPARMWDIQT